MCEGSSSLAITVMLDNAYLSTKGSAQQPDLQGKTLGAEDPATVLQDNMSRVFPLDQLWAAQNTPNWEWRAFGVLLEDALSIFIQLTRVHIL